jgi:hypothetical protein
MNRAAPRSGIGLNELSALFDARIGGYALEDGGAACVRPIQNKSLLVWTGLERARWKILACQCVRDANFVMVDLIDKLSWNSDRVAVGVVYDNRSIRKKRQRLTDDVGIRVYGYMPRADQPGINRLPLFSCEAWHRSQ